LRGCRRYSPLAFPVVDQILAGIAAKPPDGPALSPLADLS
jgi:hypothetical protein